MNNSGVVYIGGGFMGDNDYYNNQGPNNPKNKKPDFSDLVMRDQGPNNMPGNSTNGSELNDNLPETPSQLRHLVLSSLKKIHKSLPTRRKKK